MKQQWIGAAAVFASMIAMAMLWVWAGRAPEVPPGPEPLAPASAPTREVRMHGRADPNLSGRLSEVRRPGGRRDIDPQDIAEAVRTGESEVDVDADTDDMGEPVRSVWTPTREGIQGAVDEAMPELRECYEGWLAVDPMLEGRILLSFTIAEDPDEPGIARSSDVTVAEATTEADAFEACVTSVFTEFLFDLPDGGMDVTYPVVFRSEGE